MGFNTLDVCIVSIIVVALAIGYLIKKHNDYRMAEFYLAVGKIYFYFFLLVNCLIIELPESLYLIKMAIISICGFEMISNGTVVYRYYIEKRKVREGTSIKTNKKYWEA